MTYTTDGQELALRELRSIDLASPRGLDVLSVREPETVDGWLWVEISVDCAGIEHADGGIRLRGRERMKVAIPPEFPYELPFVMTPHQRWAGTPHVQWRYLPCLYVAPSVEWQPADGMYGFVERLFFWMERAAAGTLDPAGAPLHPPVAYTTSGTPLVIARADAPWVGEQPWLGAATLTQGDPFRHDITGWLPMFDVAGARTSPPMGSAAAVLLPTELNFEYPETVHDLLMALHERGARLGEVLFVLGWAAMFREAGQPLIVVVGTAMRGTVGGQRLQHLSAWRISAAHADRLVDALDRYSGDEQRREFGEQALKDVVSWISEAKVEWCPVREDRPEIVERRDSQSPLQAFAGKRVAVWGCGALGAPIADAVVRAGAAAVVVHDNATVHPGVLVRQPYTDEDLGRPKARALAERLDRIFPATPVTAVVGNVLSGPLSTADWHGGADIVIDATASGLVRAKLERVRRLHPQLAIVVTALIGHTAEHGIVAVAGPGYSGAAADALRATKLACTRNPRLTGFLQEFWPDPPRADHFQPEPGCSSPTFRGSGSETAALANLLLTAAAGELKELAGDAVAHLIALATANHARAAHARLQMPAAVVLPDAAGRFEVRLAATAAAQIRAGMSSARRRLGPASETGGVLFGERDDAAGVIWVDNASMPPPDSRESPDLFLCGTVGVQEMDSAKRTRTTGTTGFLGMWHTHPNQSADFSARDLRGMLELLDASESPRAEGLIAIVGWAATAPQLGAYVFERKDLRTEQATITAQRPAALPTRAEAPRDVGLALSGGGSRAVAFHLGCLRALHDRGVLTRVRAVSGVSGGSVMAALWAYFDDDFDAFDVRVRVLLRRGLARDVVRQALLSRRAPQAVASAAVATARLGRRRISRTDAFCDVLAERVCGHLRLDAPRREGIDVVINACDLRTGSAFRFGSIESGTWRSGTVVANDVSLATAVAASAAYPVILPALDRQWQFERCDGTRSHQRVVLTDGGVFDNLGITPFEPGRSAAYSTNVHPVDFVIACDAGQGLLGPRTPVLWPSRIKRSFESTFRKVQDGGRARLHQAAAAGDLRGFLLSYLGQQDHQLTDPPADLIPRGDVIGYPTNFSAMAEDDLVRLSRRGEQVTRAVLDAYHPDL